MRLIDHDEWTDEMFLSELQPRKPVVIPNKPEQHVIDTHNLTH